MGLNHHLLELAKARIKRGFVEQTPPYMPAGQPPSRGPMGPAGDAARAVGRAAQSVGRAVKSPATTAGRGVDALGRTALRHPILSAGVPLAGYGAYKLHEGMNQPESETKQADMPATPMSQPTGGLPVPGTPPPTNAAAVPPAQTTNFGSISSPPVQQTDQAQPMVTTSQGAANMPKQPVQGAQQRAPGLVKPSGQ